jgi:hypothetical protein
MKELEKQNKIEGAGGATPSAKDNKSSITKS